MRPLDADRWRARLLVAALGVAILVAIAPYAPGLLGAAVLYVIFAPVHRRLAPRVGGRAATILAVAMAAGLFILPGAWLVGSIIAQAPEILRGFSRSDVLARLAALRIGDLDVGTHLARTGGAVLSWLSQQALRLIAGAMHGALNVVIALFGLWFLLRSAHAAWARTKEYLPFSDASADLLRDRFRSVTEATLLGTALTAALQGSIVGVGFWLVGLPHAAFWGMITAVVSILPVLGSALVWLPGVLVLLAEQRYGAALALAAIGGIVASNIDNVTRPMVNRRMSDLHPMTTLLGAAAGVSVLGIAGLLLGPLAIAWFLELLRIYRREYGPPASPSAAGASAPTGAKGISASIGSGGGAARHRSSGTDTSIRPERGGSTARRMRVRPMVARRHGARPGSGAGRTHG
jgi:predicted PurR-regulated permease PerM